MTAIKYLNYCASINASKLSLNSSLISKYNHLGNELCQPDVGLSQSNVITYPDDEPPDINSVF